MHELLYVIPALELFSQPRHEMNRVNNLHWNTFIKNLVVTKNLIRYPWATIYCITIGRQTQLYNPIKLYSRVLHQKLFIPHIMTCDDSNLTQRLWRFYIPLFIKLLWNYTLSILFKINFGLTFLTPTWNTSCK